MSLSVLGTCLVYTTSITSTGFPSGTYYSLMHINLTHAVCFVLICHSVWGA